MIAFYKVLNLVLNFEVGLRTKQKCPEYLSLKVPNVKFDLEAFVDSRHCLTDTSKSYSTLGTCLHAHFDFKVFFNVLTYQCTHVENLISNINLMFRILSGMCLLIEKRSSDP